MTDEACDIIRLNKDRIEHLVDVAKASGRESGMLFCTKEEYNVDATVRQNLEQGNIKISSQIVGEPTRLRAYRGQCPPDTDGLIGSVHTHSFQEPMFKSQLAILPSPVDIKKEENQIICVADVDNKVVGCYDFDYISPSDFQKELNLIEVNIDDCVYETWKELPEPQKLGFIAERKCLRPFFEEMQDRGVYCEVQV